MTCQDSDQDSLMAEEIEVSTEMHVLDMLLDEEELDQNMSIGEQEFGEREGKRWTERQKGEGGDSAFNLSQKNIKLNLKTFLSPLYCSRFLPLLFIFLTLSLPSSVHDKALPDGLTVNGARLLFGRALRQNDTGVYECVVNNGIGTRKVESNITVTGNGQSYSCILGEPGQHNRTYLLMCLVPFVQHCCPLVMIWNTNFAQIENPQLN